jgi:hypothetical protein
MACRFGILQPAMQGIRMTNEEPSNQSSFFQVELLGIAVPSHAHASDLKNLHFVMETEVV